MSIDAIFPNTFSEWLSSQRWYASKGSVPRLERIGGWRVESDGAIITTHYLIDHLDGRTALYQVPLSERAEPLDGIQHIGMLDGLYVYDATSDLAYAAAIIRIMLDEEIVRTSVTDGGAPGDTVSGHRQPGAPHAHVVSAKVLSGEQSNTSIICQVEQGSPIIIKVFRALHHGDNPDVILQSAIAAAGSALVPTSLGSLTGTWSDTGRADGRAIGHLAFAQEFLPGVQDAWRVALRAAEAGEDFTAAAHALGVATAEVHSILGTVMPTRIPTAADIDVTIASMRARLELALIEVPSLEELRAPIEVVFAAARQIQWPALQRIHGDFHLGQVLSVPDRGWVLLDFEGEPMRPMAERSELDVTLRDVAGMLRSFDYVAGSVQLASGNQRVVEWASAARTAFCAGYQERAGDELVSQQPLLDALEIDKALYEAVYEARNRPDWLDIPVAAIRRLAENSKTTSV
ncbi:MAG TPA: phosphotransferase [Glaciihabitans sp.]|nr:phosphotransferase [Glaciihabitans sp.]